MKPLLAIITCAKNTDRANNQRRTWIPTALELFDVRFFLGKQTSRYVRSAAPDEVLLDVDDDYESLPAKVQEALRWAVFQDYEFIVKLDDDVFLRPQRFNALPWRQFDYWGFRNEIGFNAGFCYTLSRDAAQLVCFDNLDPNEHSEDRWVHSILKRYPTMKQGSANRDGLLYTKHPKAEARLRTKTAALAEITTLSQMQDCMRIATR